MKYFWGGLTAFFLLTSIFAGVACIDKKEYLGTLIFSLLLTSLSSYFYKKSKDKKTSNVLNESTHQKKSDTNTFIEKLYLFFGAVCGGLAVFSVIKHFTSGTDLLPAVILFVLFCIIAVLYDKAKKKNTIKNTAEQPPQIPNAELQDFFDKSCEENIQSIEASFDENTDESKKKHIISDKIEHVVELAYKDGIISEDEESKITEILAHYGMKASDLPRYTHEMLIKGLIIRDLLEGKYPNRIVVPNNTFNLMKSEKMIFAFSGMPISEIKTVSEYQAGSQGFSFRIMKGVYYHAGGTKGKRIEKKTVKSLGCSDVVITNKHVYFQANGDAMRIKHDKIVSIIPDSEGVTVFRDGARQNPLCFQTDDAWFLANVMKNAQNVG